MFDIRGLISAFHTITALPIPGKGCERAEDSFVWFPWVGATLGLLAFGAAKLGCAYCIPPEVRLFWVFALAVLIVSGWSLLTRGFHLDGLADMCDGFGGGWTPERVLEIMRDSRIGSFGVIALVLGLLLKVMAVAMLLGTGHGLGLIIAPVVARWAMVYQASFNKYARREVAKVSMANHFIDCANSRHFVGACLHTALVLGILIAVVPVCLSKLAIILVVALLTAEVIGRISRSKVGGVTGDILGATCELVEMVCLLACGLCLI